MRPINVLVTAVGCPGASTLLKMLKYKCNRDITLVGVDCDPQASGQFFVDKFYQVPKAEHKDYLAVLIDILQKEQIDVLLPESSLEIPVLALYKSQIEILTSAKVLVSCARAVDMASNKYLAFLMADKADVPVPEWRFPHTLAEFVSSCYELGYPEKAVCFKPHIAKGSRGFRIIDPKISLYDQLMKYKPNSKYITLDQAHDALAQAEKFPELLVMEFVEGMEYTADCLCMCGVPLVTMVKSNEQARWGVTVKGETLERPYIVENVAKILNKIPLSYNVNLQFIDGKLIEINPRVSTFIYQDDLIPPYLAIQLALDEIDIEQAKAYQEKVGFGRRFIRYMDQVFYNQKGL